MKKIPKSIKFYIKLFIIIFLIITVPPILELFDYEKIEVNFKDVRSKTAQEWIETAEKIEKIGQNEDAIKSYTNALKLLDKKEAKADIYNERGSLFDKLKNYKKAENDYLEAKRLDPNNMDVYANLLKMYDKKKLIIKDLEAYLEEIKKAEEVYFEGIKRIEEGKVTEDIDKWYIFLNWFYGNCFSINGEKNLKKAKVYYEKALKRLERTDEENDHFFKVYIVVSRVNVKLENYEEGKKYAKLVLEEDEDNDIALNLLGFSYYSLGEYKLALKYFKKAAENGNPHARGNIEITKKKMKQNNENDKK
ncbi:MAG: tetratricopeptide repeat protein [Fusobacteriota bacterium]